MVSRELVDLPVSVDPPDPWDPLAWPEPPVRLDAREHPVTRELLDAMVLLDPRETVVSLVLLVPPAPQDPPEPQDPLDPLERPVTAERVVPLALPELLVLLALVDLLVPLALVETRERPERLAREA